MVNVRFRDYWMFAPSREQWESDQYIQNGTYRACLALSRIGICSHRWTQLVKKNKLESMGRTGEAQKLRRYEK